MGKSFVSFYTPPKDGVRLHVGSFGMSQQLVDEVHRRYEAEIMGAIGDIVAGERERAVNGHIGPMHGPSRYHLREIQRAEMTARRNRENIAALGRPAGAFRRAS